MSTVKVGVIGYGGMGGYHVKHMAKSGIIEAKGVYDIDPKSQKRAAIGWKNLTVHRPKKRSDVAGRCRQPIMLQRQALSI